MKTISNIFSFKEERIEEEEGIRYEYATRGCSEQASKNSSSSIVTSSWPLCCVEMDSVSQSVVLELNRARKGWKKICFTF